MLEAELSQREEREQETERQRETERSLQSVSQAVVRLSRVLSSSSSRPLCISSERVLSLDLSSLLSVLSQTESTLQWNHEELQRAKLSLRRLGDEKSTLEFRAKQLEDDNQQLQMHTQLKLTHTQDLLNREREVSSSLRLQVDEVQRREEEVKRENDRLRRERDRQEERSRQLETETHRRVETELLENIGLTERETLHRLEIHSLKGALEREQLDKRRAEEEAADAKDALQKSRECVLRLSSSECVLKREIEDGQGALEKMAALNLGLASDKRELQKQLLEMERELSDSRTQVQSLTSEVSSLQREVKTLNADYAELR